MTKRYRAKRRRHRVLYFPLLGAALSFLVPLGWLFIQVGPEALKDPLHIFAILGRELAANAVLFSYMQLIGLVTLTLAGLALGLGDDRLREHYTRLLSQRRLLSIKNRQLALLSITDNLTGLANRRRLFEIYPVEYKRALRYKSDLCVLLVDVDFFKRINDVHGHFYGDFVLHELGQIFASSRRETDYVARTGGEEFCFLLTETGIQDGLRFADRLRENVANYRFEHKGIRADVSLSGGVASIKDVEPTDLDDKGHRLLTLADEALYEAKELGRNRIVRYEHKPPALVSL
ncbi:MAG: GGDEF domain-containing protein [Pseudomonadota bacterium]